MPLTHLTKKDVAYLAGSRVIFDRGQAYARRGAVTDGCYDGERLSARVLGTSRYAVTIVDTEGGLDCRCDCPFEGHVCKHIVATLLEFIDHRDAFAARAQRERKLLATIGEDLRQLPREELERLILSLIETDGRRDARLTVMDALDREGVDTPTRQRWNLAQYEEMWAEIEGILGRLDGDDLEEGAAEYELGELLERMQELLAGDRLPAGARRAHLDRLLDLYERGGARIAHILRDAVLATARTNDDWHRVAERLEDGPDHGRSSRRHHDDPELIIQIYRDRLHDEKGYLKRRLAKLRSAADYHDLALYYQRKGQAEEAVRMAEEGLVKATGPAADLIDFLLPYYQARGDYDNTLRLYRLAFLHSPRLATYRKLKAATRRKDWPEVSRDCLSRLPDGPELARIHLYEKRYDLVLEYVLKGSPDWWPGQKDVFADALRDHYPEEVIGYYMAQVDRLLQARSRRAYRAAAGYLKKMRRLHALLDRPDEFRRLLSDLRLGNANRPALLEELSRIRPPE
ncbi:MAG TPA: SWIM zinc finger family protein [Bacillota bacterium]